MHECGRYQDSGTEVSGEEESVIGYWEGRKAPDDQREGAGEGAEQEDEEEGEDMEGRVVGMTARPRATFWALAVGHFVMWEGLDECYRGMVGVVYVWIKITCERRRQWARRKVEFRDG